MTIGVLASLFLAFPVAQTTDEPASLQLRVRRADDAPGADATVVLVAAPWRLPPLPELVQHVEGTSDAHGEVTLRLPFGHDFSAWAVTQRSGAEAGATYAITNVVEGVTNGRKLVLVEREQRQVEVEVELVGAEAWAADGPLVVEALCVLGNRVVVPCPPSTAGRVRIPPLPDAVLLCVRTRAGQWIVGDSVPLGVEDRRRLAAEAASGRSGARRDDGVLFQTVSESLTRVVLPPPVALHVVVEGPKGPLRDARVSWVDRADRRLIGVTDRKGRTALQVPAVWSARGAPFLRDVSLWIAGDGCASVHWFTEDLAVLDEDGDPLPHVLELPAGSSVEGRLSITPKAPARNVPLLVHTGRPSGTAFTGEQASFDDAPRVVWTDDEGAFTVTGLAPHVAWQLSVPLSSEQLGLLAGDGPPLAPSVVLAASPSASKKRDKLGKLVLSAFRPVELSLLAGDVPAAFASLAFREHLDARMQEEHVGWSRTGPEGRVRLLARPRSRLVLGATRADSSTGSSNLEVVEVGAGRKTLEVELRAR